MRDIALGPPVTGEFIRAGTQHLLQAETSFEVRPARELPHHRGHDAGTLAQGSPRTALTSWTLGVLVAITVSFALVAELLPLPALPMTADYAN